MGSDPTVLHRLRTQKPLFCSKAPIWGMNRTGEPLFSSLDGFVSKILRNKGPGVRLAPKIMFLFRNKVSCVRQHTTAHSNPNDPHFPEPRSPRA